MADVISTVGVINMANRDSDRTGCFDVCRSDHAVHLRINRMGSEVVAVIPPGVARDIAALLVRAADDILPEQSET